MTPNIQLGRKVKITGHHRLARICEIHHRAGRPYLVRATVGDRFVTVTPDQIVKTKGA